MDFLGPSLHKECKHELLSLIVEELAKKAKAGVHVQLFKVKSHVGIEGNEKADALAHEACKPESCNCRFVCHCNDIASEGQEIREDISWLALLVGRFTMPLEGLQPLSWMF